MVEQSFTTDDKGWTWIFNIKNPISKPINNPYQKDLERVASSFYVSNLPDSLDAKGLWNACISYGRLVDAYITNKRSIRDQDFITIEDSSTVILLKVKDVESMGNIYAIYKNAGRMCIATKSHKHISEKVLVEDTSSNIDVNKVVKDAEVANSVEDDFIDDLNDLNENLNNLGHDFMDMENLENAFLVQPDTLIKEENFAQHEIQKDEEDPQTKSALSNKLADFMHNHNGKFILFGDLNVVRNEQEKFGSIFSSHKAGHFNAFIDSSGLIDLPIGGCYYTWMNKAGTKLSKLDRFLISDDILEAIPDIHITALDRLWSDHTPILFHVKKSNFGPSPFKLYNSWLLRDGFDDLIRSTWSSMENHSNDRSHMSHEKLRSIKGSIKQWHNNIKINDRNKRLEALNDLKFIDKKIDEGLANENDRENHIKLLQDIDNLDNLEAHYLIQKAHIKWDIEAIKPSVLTLFLTSIVAAQVSTIRIPARGVVTTEAPSLLPMEILESNRSMSVPSVEGSPRAIYQLGLLKKAKAQVARHNERIHVKEDEIKRLGEEVESLKAVETKVHSLCNQTKNLETLLEAEVDMKKAIEAKNAELVMGKERIHATFKEFKKYEDDRVEKRCVEMDARLDALSIDFDEELYPHMLTAIAWTAKGMSEGLEYRVKQGEAKLDLAAIEAYDAEADDKYIAALHALKDLKYPLVDQLEKLKDTPLDLIMVSLHLESDTGEDAPQWIRDLLPSSSQLTIPVYPKVHNHEDPWAFKEEILLGNAIAVNISHAEKKKKCRVMCRTHGICSAYHARSDGVLVSVPTVAPQGLAILLADATTQTDISEYKASLKLLRSKSLPPFYNLDWP
ncbi:gypsy type transposase [Tanacetum coccineum]